MNITRSEYWTEVNALAVSIVEEAMRYNDNDPEAAEAAINDRISGLALHETIDGHQWIIYCAYNLDVLQHSDNDEYFEFNIGGADEILRDGGIGQLHTVMAFYALYADVHEAIGELDFEDVAGVM